MSNFNEYFKKRGAKNFVDKFFKTIDRYSSKKLTNLKFTVDFDEDAPASYFVENNLTATFIVNLEYTINDGDEIYRSSFTVPREIGGVFIIEGDYRTATNTLDGDFDCRFNVGGSGSQEIKFDYNRVYDIKKQILKITNTGGFTYSERNIEVPFDKIDTYNKKEEFLKLTEYQAKKLEIKLDLPSRPEYITTGLIDACIAFGDDRSRDLIIDKTINSVPRGFERYMFISNPGRYRSITRTIMTHWNKYGKLNDPINSISTTAEKYFKGSSQTKKGDKDVQVPPGINDLNLTSLQDKVVIPETVAYNTTMADLIDLADTPINQNTNLQNSLTVSTHITDSGVMFDVYDKTFMKITIPYMDYLNKKVCASEYVNYETNTLKPNEKGEVEVKYRMKRKMVPVTEVELIDLHPDFRLSKITRQIPFINSTDSVRISMGTSMLKQSIPLINAQRSLVCTGRSEELKDNVLNEKFKHEKGTVTEIDEKAVTITLEDGTKNRIQRRTAIQSINDVSVYTEPKVKIGQKVKKGDIIVGSVGNDIDNYKVGLNSLVLFHAYHGLVNEDALVVSESYAQRMASYSIIDLSINVNTSSTLHWVAEIGKKVKTGDPLVSIYQGVKLDSINKAVNEKLGGVFDGGGDFGVSQYTVERFLKVPNNIEEAWISDVSFNKLDVSKAKFTGKEKKPDYTISHMSDKVIKEWKSNNDRQVVYDKFPEYIAADRLRPIIMDLHEVRTAYTIRVRIIKRTVAMIGSKITNRYGGKGVVSKVVPDEMMPIMVDKKSGKKYRVEVVMNPYSTINRKIAGVLVECSLGLIAHKIQEMVDEYKKTESGKKKIIPLLSKYYPGRYDKMDPDKFIKLHESKPIEEVYYFNVGCYSDFTPEKVDKWLDELGIESQSDILMPESELTDLDELKENLSEEEYNEVVKKMTGKFIKVDKKLQCGWITLEQLYHIPSYSSKVTSSLFGTGFDPKRNEPIMGKGRYRSEGQKIGEMELWSYLSRNANKFIKSARKDTERADNQIFLNNLLSLGLTVTDSKGYNQGGSDLKSRVGSMKNKFRIKNNPTK